MKHIAAVIIPLVTVFLLSSCQKEIGFSEPEEETNDSIYISQLTFTTDTGQDTVMRQHFEYDASKRLSRRTLFLYQFPITPGLLSKQEFIFSYTGNSTSPAIIYEDRINYVNPASSIKDTTYLFYKDGFVSRDSAPYYFAGNFSANVFLYDKVGPTRTRTIIRRYQPLPDQIDTNYAFTLWTNGNLLTEIDSAYSNLSTPPQLTVYTNQFTYDTKTNPLKRIQIPYLVPASIDMSTQDLSLMSVFNHPGQNNILTSTTSATSTNVEYHYNAIGLPDSAKVMQQATIPMKIYYKYTSL